MYLNLKMYTILTIRSKIITCIVILLLNYAYIINIYIKVQFLYPLFLKIFLFFINKIIDKYINFKITSFNISFKIINNIIDYII